MSIQINLLGIPQLLRDGVVITDLGTNKVKALLYYLAVQKRACTRNELVGLLWGNSAEIAARRSLRVALSKLRKALPNHIQSDNETITLSSQVEVDVHQLVAAIASEAPHDWQQALPTLRGTFLETFQVRRAPGFENWLLAQQEHWQQVTMQLLSKLASHYETKNKIAQAIAVVQQWLALDTWREDIQRRLMRLYAQDGQRAAAITQFERCRHLLATELAVEPSAETITLFEQIKAGKISSQNPTTTIATTQNLPLPATRLIGRHTLLPEILLRLGDPECRLLSLVGAGGMGKTRLAIAAGLAIGRTETVCWVDLAGVAADLQTPLEITLVEALNIELQPQPTPLQQIINYLNQHKLLLIVDNLEHLIEHVGMLGELVQAVANLTILATSRERLNLGQEWLIEVAGLAQAEAVLLFSEVARRIRPNFTPADHLTSIEEICQRVGGMPLAIELVANWLRTLDIKAISTELSRSIDIISSRSRDLPQRHRSLRAVFDYSWQQMSVDEQTALPRLAVFRGGFSRVAADAVGFTSMASSLFTLQGLSDKSLLRRRADGRFHLHEAIRQYALTRLSPEQLSQVQASHAAYFATWLTAGSSVRISAELDNLHAAWGWVIDHDLSLSHYYIEPLAAYYDSENMTAETVHFFTTILASDLPTQSDRVKRASWRRRLGEAHFRLGQMTICRGIHEAALRDLGLPLPSNRIALGLAMSRQMAQQVVHRRQLPPQSTQDAELKLEAIRLFERLGQVFFFESDSMMAGYTALKGLNLAETIAVSAELARLYANTCLAIGMFPQPKLAHVYQTAALNTLASLSDPATEAWVLEILSIYNSGLGNWQQVAEWIERALHQATAIGDQRRYAECLVMRATHTQYTGQLQTSYATWEIMYTGAIERADTQVQSWALTGMIDVLLKLGQLPEQTDLFATLHTILDSGHDDNDTVNALSVIGLHAQIELYRGNHALAATVITDNINLLDQLSPTSYSTLDGYENFTEACFQLYTFDPQKFTAMLDFGLRSTKQFQKYAAIFPIGRAGAILCRGWYDWLSGKEKSALKRWKKGLQQARELEMRMDEAKLLTLFGRIPSPRQAEYQREAYDKFSALQALGEISRWECTPT